MASRAVPAAEAAPELRDIDPHADGSPSGVIPTYDWRSAPTAALATRRQLRAAGLRPGGHGPVAQLKCRRCSYRPQTQCTHLAWLYRVDLALPKIPMTLAKEWALDRAMAARQSCPKCLRRYAFCLPLKSLGSCLECHDGTPADPSTYVEPPAGHRLAA